MAVLNPYDVLLRDVIIPDIQRTELMYSVFSDRLQRSNKNIKGDYVEAEVMVEGSQGIGAGVLRKGAYPTAGLTKYLKYKALLKANRGSLELAGVDYEVLSSGTPNEQVASQIATEVASFKEEWATDINRQYWGTSAGTLASTSGTGTCDTITVTDTKYFRVGMLIDVHEGTVVEDAEVTGIDEDAGTITTDATDAYTDGTVITRANAKDYEIAGVQSMVADSGTYHNLDRDTYPALRSYVKDAGAALSFILIDDFLRKIIYTKGGRPTILYTGPETADWLAWLYREEYNLTVPNTMEINLGYKAIAYTTPFGTIPFVIEPHAPTHNIWALDERTMFVRNPKAFTFKKGNDGYWFNDTDTDKVVARGNWYSELCNIASWKSGRLHNYTDPRT